MANSWQDVVDKRSEGSEEFPIYHEITWWIERELTLDEWIELDNRQSDIFEDMDIPISGVAGPIPRDRRRMTGTIPKNEYYVRAAILYVMGKNYPNSMTEEEITLAVNGLTPEEEFDVLQIQDIYTDIEENYSGVEPLPLDVRNKGLG